MGYEQFNHWEQAHRSGKKQRSSPKARKHAAGLPMRDPEPYRQLHFQDLYSYSSTYQVGLGPRLDSDPSVIHSGDWNPWNDPTCAGASMPIYPSAAQIYLNPNPGFSGNLISGTTRTLTVVEAPKPALAISYPDRGLPQTKYNSAHILILTWAFHDLAGGFDETASEFFVSLEEETLRLRDTFENYGYYVHECAIPMNGTSEWVKKTMKEFLGYASDDTLLLVYYHGHGGLDEAGELVFNSHEHPQDTTICQAAAADLYHAMMKQESVSKHDRAKMIQAITAKYERFRPIAEVKWEEIRSPILRAPCDLLLILDCCAAGGANLRHVNWQPRKADEFAKHLYAACGFESSSRGDMTAALCDVLDDYQQEGAGTTLTTKRLHQIIEDRLQKRSVGAQPIFKQLLPVDAEQSITIPMF